MPMYAHGILIGVVFVVPMERRTHERKVELMRRKVARSDERPKQLAMNEHSDSAGKDANSNLFSGNNGVD